MSQSDFTGSSLGHSCGHSLLCPQSGASWHRAVDCLSGCRRLQRVMVPARAELEGCLADVTCRPQTGIKAEVTYILTPAWQRLHHSRARAWQPWEAEHLGRAR